MAQRQSPLFGVHERDGAAFTGFGGWEMPVDFGSIREEHRSVRESAGIFDVSHMGEIEVAGPDAETLLQRLTTNDVSALAQGEAQYAMITDDEGIILDDTVVYRLPMGRTPAGDDAAYLFVPNAGHDGEMADRWTAYRDEWELDAAVRNATESYGMVAVQGPDAEDAVAGAAGSAVRDLGWFTVAEAEIAGATCLVSRSGYTGEDGFEVICPWDAAERVWDALECPPCGLGARDTLRIEMGLLLSGQDFDPDENPRNPYEAGVSFTVDLDHEFVGRDALARVREAGVDETFVGLVLEERGVPRHGYDIVADGGVIGEVTSGTMSPTLGEPVGLGYVPVEYADPDTEVGVEIRGEPKAARIQDPPFITPKR